MSAKLLWIILSLSVSLTAFPQDRGFGPFNKKLGFYLLDHPEKMPETKVTELSKDQYYMLETPHYLQSVMGEFIFQTNIPDAKANKLKEDLLSIIEVELTELKADDLNENNSNRIKYLKSLKTKYQTVINSRKKRAAPLSNRELNREVLDYLGFFIDTKMLIKSNRTHSALKTLTLKQFPGFEVLSKIPGLEIDQITLKTGNLDQEIHDSFINTYPDFNFDLVMEKGTLVISRKQAEIKWLDLDLQEIGATLDNSFDQPKIMIAGGFDSHQHGACYYYFGEEYTALQEEEWVDIDVMGGTTITLDSLGVPTEKPQRLFFYDGQATSPSGLKYFKELVCIHKDLTVLDYKQFKKEYDLEQEAKRQAKLR